MVEYKFNLARLRMLNGKPCPCLIEHKIPEDICPCKTFLDTGECRCQLFTKVKNEEE